MWGAAGREEEEARAAALGRGSAAAAVMCGSARRLAEAQAWCCSRGGSGRSGPDLGRGGLAARWPVRAAAAQQLEGASERRAARVAGMSAVEWLLWA